MLHFDSTADRLDEIRIYERLIGATNLSFYLGTLAYMAGAQGGLDPGIEGTVRKCIRDTCVYNEACLEADVARVRRLMEQFYRQS